MDSVWGVLLDGLCWYVCCSGGGIKIISTISYSPPAGAWKAWRRPAG